MFSEEHISLELRALARTEARGRLGMEAQLLRAGYLDQEDIPVALPQRAWWCPRLPFHLRAARAWLHGARSINRYATASHE